MLSLRACLKLNFIKIGGCYFFSKTLLKEEIPRITVTYINNFISLADILDIRKKYYLHISTSAGTHIVF